MKVRNVPCKIRGSKEVIPFAGQCAVKILIPIGAFGSETIHAVAKMHEVMKQGHKDVNEIL